MGRTATQEWDELTSQRTVREVVNIPLPAIRRVARFVLSALGVAILLVAAGWWIST